MKYFAAFESDETVELLLKPGIFRRTSTFYGRGSTIFSFFPLPFSQRLFFQSSTNCAFPE